LDVIGGELDAGCRRHVPDVGEERPLAGIRGGPGQEAGDLRPVRLPLLREGGDDRFRLRRKADPGALDGVAERLDREAVAREDEPPFTLVPERERPHAVEALEAVGTPRRIRVEDDLGVGLRAEASATALEVAAELDVVVDLAVVGDPEAPLGEAHRLVTCGRRVDDAQAPVGQADSAVQVDAVPVRAAVNEAGAHAFERGLVDRLARPLPDPGDAAHLAA